MPPPAEILVPGPVADAELRAELLSELAERKVRIFRPRRGEGVRLAEMALENAKLRFAAAHSKAERAQQALGALKRALRTERLPHLIECYDNSNIQGTDPVGSMVTFKDGRPWKPGYRIFKIKTVVGADDYATMKEVLGRRLKRALDGSEGWELPDLLVIDGGRGQLGMVAQVCRELGVAVIGPNGVPRGDGPPLRLISIAKPREGERTDKIYEPGRSNPVPLRANSPGLHLLQHARDEAHRFGVHHHRKQRTGRTLVSSLDGVPGIGPTLRKRLLREFGSVSKIRKATVDELAAVSGMGRSKAEAVLEALG